MNTKTITELLVKSFADCEGKRIYSRSLGLFESKEKAETFAKEFEEKVKNTIPQYWISYLLDINDNLCFSYEFRSLYC